MDSSMMQDRAGLQEGQKPVQNGAATQTSSSADGNANSSDLSDFLAALKTSSIEKLTTRQNKVQDDIRYLQKRIYDSEDNYICKLVSTRKTR